MQGFQNKKIPIYILGRNHRWQAYSLLRAKYSNQQDKIKELSLSSVLAAVYWWSDLLEQSINEMRALAMCHNVEGECHVSMTFWDKMKFIHDELTHKPKAIVSETQDSNLWTVLVYKWMQALKEDVMSIQSLDPLYQLAQDVWDLVLELGQPAKPVEGRLQKLKPLTSITTFCLLASLTNNQKLQLLSALYKGDLDIGKVEARACKLKVCKQVKAAFVADANMLVTKLTTLLGKDICKKEVDCWLNAFSQTSKGGACAHRASPIKCTPWFEL